MRESKSRALTNLAIPQVPPENKHGSLSRTRTYDRSVNSRLLYQLSYQGMAINVDQSHFAPGTFSHATCFPIGFALRVRFSDRSVAVSTCQSASPFRLASWGAFTYDLFPAQLHPSGSLLGQVSSGQHLPISFAFQARFLGCFHIRPVSRSASPFGFASRTGQ